MMNSKFPALWGQDFINLPPIQEEGKPIILQVPWLDFIYKWSALSYEENFFSTYGPNIRVDEKDDNRLLILNSNFVTQSSDGQLFPFTEMYYARETKDHTWQLKFIVFINNEAGTARIECFDPVLVGQCKEFMKEPVNV